MQTRAYKLLRNFEASSELNLHAPATAVLYQAWYKNNTRREPSFYEICHLPCRVLLCAFVRGSETGDERSCLEASRSCPLRDRVRTQQTLQEQGCPYRAVAEERTLCHVDAPRPVPSGPTQAATVVLGHSVLATCESPTSVRRVFLSLECSRRGATHRLPRAAAHNVVAGYLFTFTIYMSTAPRCLRRVCC